MRAWKKRAVKKLPLLLLLAAAGLIAVLAFAACGDDDSENLEDTGSTAAPSQEGGDSENLEDTGSTPAPSRQAVDGAVLDVSLSAERWALDNGENCPKVVATVSMTSPGTVVYRWTRSDGASGQDQTLEFAAAGTETVEDAWQLGSEAEGGPFWLGFQTVSPVERDWGQVEILPCFGGTPTPTPSPEPTVALSDEFQVINVTLTADTWSDDYYEQCPVVRAEIETDGPGVVTYRWTRSDDARASRQTLEFGSAGKQTIETTWTLGSAVDAGETYWIGLLIEGPQEKDWGHVEIRPCKKP